MIFGEMHGRRTTWNGALLLVVQLLVSMLNEASHVPGLTGEFICLSCYIACIISHSSISHMVYTCIMLYISRVPLGDGPVYALEC